MGQRGIVAAHVFPFSPRPGTPAARMPQVEREIVKARAARLNQAETLEEQQMLMREITALEGRLERCRKALDDIERVIARLTR